MVHEARRPSKILNDRYLKKLMAWGMRAPSLQRLCPEVSQMQEAGEAFKSTKKRQRRFDHVTLTSIGFDRTSALCLTAMIVAKSF